MSSSSDTGERVLLEVQNLSKSFPSVGRGPVQVLTDLNLSVRRSELIAIVGESGTGKSTLLHILGALSRPDSGQLTFDGTNVLGKSDDELSEFRNEKIGFVFQFHHLLPEFSAEENVMMPALVRGDRPKQARGRALELLERVGLLDRTTHRPAELSGGEKQRVAIARALMNHPDLILADEPTGNLDEKPADTLHQELMRLSRDLGQTFIMVTHNMQFASMADRILVLEHGQLSQRD